MTLRFTVFGTPIPQGSEKITFHGPLCPRCRSKPWAKITHDNRRLEPWRKAVRRAAEPEDPRPLEGPVLVSIVFLLPRPKGHLGTRGLRPSAPVWPMKKPDLDKLARGILDALTGVAFVDDSQVVQMFVMKKFAPDTPRAEVRVTPIEDGVDA